MPVRKAISFFVSAHCALWFVLSACNTPQPVPLTDKQATYQKYYGNDYEWYIKNVPFFDCSDTTIRNVYYYRWQLYKAHLRSVGTNEFIVTEFINHVPWDREPYCTINAASMHHIYEGRWLRDDSFMDGYITNLILNGGNNRKYSESIADAAYARYLVNGDDSYVIGLLDSMKSIYNAWYDHYDSSKQMYFIPAMPDATEYTIASIDASGGKDGFEGGEAFRPTINSYMYGNARAIAHIAALKGDDEGKREYEQKAAALKQLVEQHLWNDSLNHFVDRYKVNNKYVKYWSFIRGRELAGMAPWYFNLPADKQKFAGAWKHVTDTNYLLGQYGFRTNEPSYEHYFKQFVFFEGKPGSQWNGPSWPYQSSQTLTALANLLNNYHQNVAANDDYIRLLRLYANQHILPNGKIDLVENYDPNKGGPIVYYYWSNHYLHSTFNNLVISGLCGVRPMEGDSLTVNPLVDSSISYFMLDDINYRGHKVTVIYDRDGSRYNVGKGTIVFVDNKKAELVNNKAFIAKSKITQRTPEVRNAALNIAKTGFPKPSTSVNFSPDTSVFQAVDGRIWYFPEIINYWSTRGSKESTDWYAVDFGREQTVSAVKLFLFADDKEFYTPDSIQVQYKSRDDDSIFTSVDLKSNPAIFVSNTENKFSFEPVNASQIRILFHHHKKQVALSEVVIN